MNEVKIYGAINAVMNDMGAIGKDKRNTQQGFNYRGVDDVMNALNPLMVKHRLFCVPEVLEQTRETRTTSKGGALVYSILKMRYTLIAEDGSSIAAVVIGEGMDSGDKASNKAMSVAYKYAMFQIFSIPTEEMRDPDAESYETMPYTTASQKPANTEQKKKAPAVCEQCGCNIEAVTIGGGMVTAEWVEFTTERRTGRRLCYKCYDANMKKAKKAKRDADNYAATYMHEDAGDRV